MTQLARNNLSDQLAQIIGKQIIRNELKSGEMIYETKISKEWGVSRSPVRDALHMLEQNRLVERTASGSYKVTELTKEYILNFYDTVNIIYQYAFAKAAENATASEIKDLKAALNKLEKSLETKNFETYLEGVTEYGIAILTAARNPIIEKIALELMPSAERVQYTTLTILPDYLEILVDIIRKGHHHVVNQNPEQVAKDFAEFADIHKEIHLENVSKGSFAVNNP